MSDAKASLTPPEFAEIYSAHVLTTGKGADVIARRFPVAANAKLVTHLVAIVDGLVADVNEGLGEDRVAVVRHRGAKHAK